MSVQAVYESRPYTPTDEAQVLELLRASLGESGVLQRTSAMWRWKHEENAFGRSLGRVAVDGEGRVVGLRAFLRWRFVEGGRTISAVRPVDTATHPDHQRRGIFARLTTEALADARRDGVELIYNTPNAQSRPGYLKLGWREIGKVQPLVRVLHRRRFVLGLARHMVRRGGPRQPHAEDTFFKGEAPPLARAAVDDPRLGDLLRADAELWGRGLRTDRSVEYLKWRYADHPTIRYRAVCLEQGGELEACAVVRTNTRFGLREAVVSEVLVNRADERLVGRLVDALSTELSADYLIAYFPQGTFRRDGLRRRGFRRAPLHGMTLVANPLDRPLGSLVSLAGWGVGLGDLEFF